MSAPYHFRIAGLGISDRDFNAMPLGRQAEYWPKIREFQQSSKHGHIGQKRRSHRSAFAEFKRLHDVKEFFYKNDESSTWRSDSIDIWYRS